MKITDYSNLAEKYDKNKYRVSEIKYDLDLEEYIKINKKSEYHVLDLSCGTGLYLQKQSEYFNKININWYGLDPSEEMLKKAYEKLSNVALIKGYAESMPYQSEAFDFISNNYAFHHYTNKTLAINEIYRVLKNGGIYKLHNIAIHDMPKWWVYHYFPSAYYEDLKRFWNKEVIFNELKSKGFDVALKIEYKMEEVRVVDYLDYVENRDISVLTLISDNDYKEGLERMRYDVESNPNKKIINDFAEMFFLAIKNE